MRVVFKPYDQKTWEHFFNEQVQQTGHGMPVFQGFKYQRGAGLGNFFKGLLRTILPIAKSVGKAVGKQALSTGAEVVQDVVSGQPILQSVEERSKAAGRNLLNKGANAMQKRFPSQRGRGLGKRPAAQSRSQAVQPVPKKKRLSPKKQVHSDQLGVFLR